MKIDGKDFTRYVERARSVANDGPLFYYGLGVENEGKAIEKLFEDLPRNAPIRIEDTKFRPHNLTSGVYKIININSKWDGTVLRFDIKLQKV